MIRPAKKDDLGTILNIYSIAKAFMCESGNPTQWDGSYPDAETLLADIHKQQLFVMTEDDRIYGCFALIGGEDPTYGYIDDVWMYTGITSVTADESNIGFVLINLRTKEARYYVQAGAEEYSAMDSAEGQIQEKNYTSTFPILLNVGGRPTYFMSLKDDAGLVKMYAFVDMAQYQIVGTGTSVDKAREAYLSLLADEDIETETTPDATTTVSGVVTALAQAVVDGNTQYYLRIEGVEGVTVLPANLSDDLPFLKVGDTVTVTFDNAKATQIEIK